MISFAEVSAGIRATLASHAHANDDGRTNDMVACYTSDAVVEIPGAGSFEGADNLREAFAGYRPQGPQCHMTGNTVIHCWTADSAQATSDIVFVAKGASGWSIQAVGRLNDKFRNVDGRWLIEHRSTNLDF